MELFSMLNMSLGKAVVIAVVSLVVWWALVSVLFLSG